NNKIDYNALKWIIIGLVGFIVVVLVFGVGIFVGETKARFSYSWAESYHKNFGGPKAGILGDWRGLPLGPGDFIEGHGAFGEIIKINGSDFVIKGRNDVEKIIIITEDAVIKKGRETVGKDELKISDRVVIIGSPNEEGKIEAKLIRIFNGENAKALQGRPQFPFFK
ncbi:hypothetical protein KKB68_02950, partial [Patescibacteria group bacterium]|nr:hypothetical protein [Patescibacteria group bacterium]